MARVTVRERPVWVNLISGALVLAGIFGVLAWLALTGPFSGLVWVPSSGVEMEMPVDGDWRVFDESGEVIFEGSEDEFEAWDQDNRDAYVSRYVNRRHLYPGLALIGLGLAVSFVGGRMSRGRRRADGREQNAVPR